MLDLIRQQGSTINVLGLNPQEEPEAIKTRVGYLPGELHLDENMTERANLEEIFLAYYKGEEDGTLDLILAVVPTL